MIKSLILEREREREREPSRIEDTEVRFQILFTEWNSKKKVDEKYLALCHMF